MTPSVYHLKLVPILKSGEYMFSILKVFDGLVDLLSIAASHNVKVNLNKFL